MRNLFTLVALMSLSFGLFAQDPVFSKETQVVEPAPCESFFRAAYQVDNQRLLLKYEACGKDFATIGFCGVGWCGNTTQEEFDAMNQSFESRHLLVSDLQGVTYYTQEFGMWSEIPEEITVEDIKLNPGVYVVRLNTFHEGEAVTIFTKFLVR